MDKNTFTGFILIAAIFGIFWFLNKPTEEQLAEQKRQKEEFLQQQEERAKQDSILLQQQTAELSDSIKIIEKASQLGTFASASIGKESVQTIETDLLSIQLSNKGGRIAAVELKKYKTHDSLPLILFANEEENNYGFSFVSRNNHIINSSELYFEMQPIVKTDSSQIATMRLRANENAYIDFVYNVPNNNYMLTFDVVPVNMDTILSNRGELQMYWVGKIRQQEKGRDFENRHTQLYYKNYQNDVDYLSETSDDKKEITTKLKWVAFKDQFFSSVLIANDYISSAGIRSEMGKIDSDYLKSYGAEMRIPFKPRETVGFSFYFGPNHFKTLNQYNKGIYVDDKLELEKLVPLGWALFRWVNRILVIPMFNFFGGFMANFGIIILLMTIVIKMILFPLTYKSYISSAKMRVLKPEIEKINEKIPANKPQERQRATMQLYSKVGVNPMGGCLPMLLQMPILIAMFTFFPSAIELRQQSFLWAPDLSTYDSVLSLPFNIPFYGAHVSLFCLLMAIVNVVYTKINMATQDMGNQQIPGMKYIMYFMPVMLLFFFNSYPAGLSYYYLISTLITVLQTYAIRATVDEDKLLKQLHENKNKPKKKSGFMARLEAAQKQMEAQQKAAKKR